MTELEQAAERLLLAIPVDGDGFGDFMALIPRLCAEIADHNDFVTRTAPVLADARNVANWFEPWAARIFRAVNFGGEDALVGAVSRRSQLELAYELYRGTAAESVFDDERDHDADALITARAVELGIDPPRCSADASVVKSDP